MGLFVEQLKAMIHRNVLIKMRQRKYLLLELFMPLYFVGILAVIQLSIPKDVKPAMPDPQPGAPLFGPPQTLQITVAPNSSNVHTVMELATNLSAKFMWNLSTKYFDDEHSLLEAYDKAGRKPQAAILFGGTDTVPNGNYTVYFAAGRLPKFDQQYAPGSDCRHQPFVPSPSDPCSANQYYYYNFAQLQMLIDSALIGISANHAVRVPVPDVQLQLFPKPKYEASASFLRLIVPIYVVMAFSPFVTYVVILIVSEKEKKIRVLMKMMGLKDSAYWLSWMIVYSVFSLFLSVMTGVLLHFTKIIFVTNIFIVILSLYLYGLSIISMAFMVTPFFNQAKVAGAVCSLVTTLFSALYYLSVFVQDVSPVYYWLMCLISPTAFALGIDQAVKYDVMGVGINFENMWDDDFPFAGVLIMLAVDIGLYGVLAFYLDNVLPSEFGTKRSPFFCFSWSFWWPAPNKRRSSSLERLGDNSIESATVNIQPNAEDIEPVSLEMEQQAAIRVVNLKKIFTPRGSDEVVAVNGIDLKIYEGQITALLGHNGAGKTTLINMLLGMTPPTSGTASVYGLDIRNHEDLAKIREMTGICPQHDVLFENLTPNEHLKFYGLIKGLSKNDVDEKVDKILHDIGLSDAVATLAGNLSGGQKRKLCVGIALIGNPKIIILDEPTSGVDPYSRRHLWTLLQSHKAGRLIVLTTHFMEEADILADRKAIITKGQIRCVGSSLFLKNKFGLGYHLTLVVGQYYNAQEIDGLIRSCIPQASKTLTHGQELSYLLPLDEVSRFPELLSSIDVAVKDQPAVYGIQSYGISMTTLEEIFLKLGEEGGETILDSQQTAVEHIVRNRHLSRQTSTGLPSPQTPEEYASVPLSERKKGTDLQTTSSLASSPSQLATLKAILLIRFLAILRLPKNIWGVIVAPALFLVISLVLLRLQTAKPEADVLNVWSDGIRYSYGKPAVLLNTSTDVKMLSREIGKLGLAAKVYNHTFQNLLEDAPHSFFLTSSTIGDKSVLTNVDVLFNDTNVHSLPMLVAMLNGIRGQMLNLSNLVLQPVVKLFPSSKLLVPDFNGNGFASSMLIGSLFASVPLTLTMDVIEDRERKIKHLLRVNGMKFLVYWGSFFICHLILMFISLATMMVLVAAFQVESLMNSAAMGSLFITYLLYLPTSLVYYYVISFIYKKQDQAQSTFFFILLFLGFVPFMAVFIVQAVLPNSDLGSTLHYVFCFVFPLYIPFASLNIINKVYIIHKLLSTTPTASEYFEKEVLVIIISLVVNFILYSELLRICDGLSLGETFASLYKRGVSTTVAVNNNDVIENEDQDVKEERRKVEDLGTSTEDDTPVVALQSLRKVYSEKKTWCGVNLFTQKKDTSVDAEKVAVRNLSLAVGCGEVFGLLGPNGAGKTSAIKIVVTDESPSAGKVTVAGYDVTSNFDEVFRSIGYCPQHDAQWKNITLREHLSCYAVIRGIAPDQVDNVVNRFLEGLNIEEHASKKSKALSGGTQRKLSFGISMLGDSRVVLLDEPSTGMDPQSKRFLWDTVMASFQGNRGAILTTHSMEEADVLCTRVGIMVQGALRCLGSTQHLKNKYGGGYVLELKLASSDDPNVAMLRLEQFIRNCFPRAEQQECFSSHVKYSVPQSSVSSLATIFEELERAKTEVGITEYSFSQTTLEQVFLEFAHQQEEGSLVS